MGIFQAMKTISCSLFIHKIDKNKGHLKAGTCMHVHGFSLDPLKITLIIFQTISNKLKTCAHISRPLFDGYYSPESLFLGF